MVELKVAFAVGAYWLAMGITSWMDDTLQGVVLLASAAVSLGVLYRLAKKGVNASRRWSLGIDHMLELPRWQEKTDGRLDRIEKTVAADITVTHRVEQEPPATV